VTASVAHPPVLDLTFRGLDRCDGCGILLEPTDQLAGLCAQCKRTLLKASKSRPSRRNKRKP
jgi:predicted amidophosphoribosyltransferase